MKAKRGLLLLAAGGALAGGAGLGLAQDQNQILPGPAPFGQNQVENTLAPAEVVTPLDIPPAEEAPAAEVAPPASPAPAPVSNTIDNMVAEAPPPPPPPPKRPQHPVAVLQALDKVTAETLRFEAKVNEPVRYKDLVITVHACETQASDEPYAQTAANMQVQYQPEVLGGRKPEVAREVFRGWMFGDAPGLHPFEHPIYDVWVIACKTPAPAAAPAAAPAPAGASL